MTTERSNFAIVSVLFSLVLLASIFALNLCIVQNLNPFWGLTSLACCVLSFGGAVISSLIALRS